MNKLQKTSPQCQEQTPIEISLGIDDDGMTTAKKLYEFLGLDPKNYSRWCNANILKNKFAEEHKDYEVFFLCDENPKGGRPTPDYKLTAEFAKQLSMLSKSERGEQARQYFLACEKGLVIAMNRLHSQRNDLTPIVEALQTLSVAMAKVQSDLSTLQQDQQSQTNAQLTALTNLITSALPKPYKPRFTRWMGRALDKADAIADSLGLTRRETLHRLYIELEDTYGLDLNEYQEEFCFTHNLQDTGIYTLNAINADQRLRRLFDILQDTYIEQYTAGAVVGATAM